MKYSNAIKPASTTVSVMGVACKYKRFGLKASNPTDANAAAEECVARRMAANKKAPAQTKHAEDGIAPANPLRHSWSFLTNGSINRCGRGSQTVPI